MKVDLNTRMHQDNLKAEIWHQFKLRFLNSGFALICEYKTNGSRFDILAYERETQDVVGIIEVRRLYCKKEPNLSGKQHRKYSAFGPNIYHISEFEKIPELLDELGYAFFLTKNELRGCILTN